MICPSDFWKIISINFIGTPTQPKKFQTIQMSSRDVIFSTIVLLYSQKNNILTKLAENVKIRMANKSDEKNGQLLISTPIIKKKAGIVFLFDMKKRRRRHSWFRMFSVAEEQTQFIRSNSIAYLFLGTQKIATKKKRST